MVGMRHFVFRASYGGVDGVADELLEALPAGERTERVRIGVIEALANAILHGSLRVAPRGELDDLPAFLDAMAEHESAEVTLWAGVGERVIAIYDGGPGFDWRSALRRPGRGLAIMKHVFGDVEWNEAGNCVRLHLAPLDERGRERDERCEPRTLLGATEPPPKRERPLG